MRTENGGSAKTVLARALGALLAASFTTALLVISSTSCSGTSCSSDSGCQADERCGFPASDGCSATGTCVKALDSCADGCISQCGCDGSLVCYDGCSPNGGLPDGYNPAPLPTTTTYADCSSNGG